MKKLVLVLSLILTSPTLAMDSAVDEAIKNESYVVNYQKVCENPTRKASIPSIFTEMVETIKGYKETLEKAQPMFANYHGNAKETEIYTKVTEMADRLKNKVEENRTALDKASNCKTQRGKK